MSETKSLADMAVETLAAVSRMDRGVEFEHAERHAVWGMKRIAEQIIENALRQARDLAYQADNLRELHREIEK